MARYDGGHNTEEWASLAASPDGSTVFVSGGSAGRDTEFDYVVIAYNASTGAQRWVTRYDGRAHSFDEATSLGVSVAGTKVFVSGYSEDATGNEDAVVIAYDAVTGSQLWLDRYSGAEETDARVSSLRVGLDGDEALRDRLHRLRRGRWRRRDHRLQHVDGWGGVGSAV